MPFSNTVHHVYINVPATPRGDPTVRWSGACWRASMLVSSISVLIGDHPKTRYQKKQAQVIGIPRSKDVLSSNRHAKRRNDCSMPCLLLMSSIPVQNGDH